MGRMTWDRREAWKILLVIVSFLVFINVGLRWLTDTEQPASRYPRENMDFYGLPAAAGISVNPKEQITIEEESLYAENDVLQLCQYTDAYYNEDMLAVKADYDADGGLNNLQLFEYDTAGNVYRERIESTAGKTQTRRYIYEYDDSGRVVHEEVYWDEDLAENNYYRYADLGCAGVSYTYLDEQFEGGISPYCRSHTEFLEDVDGNLLCVFDIPSAELKIPNEVWQMQWAKKGDHLAGRIQYYESGWNANEDDWYRKSSRADTEQFHLYACNPDTGQKNRIMQLIYDWSFDTHTFCLLPSFYIAQYDGDDLLWQLSYEDDRVQYYSAYQYDADGRLQAAVEYAGNGDEPYALFYRYEYPVTDGEVSESYSRVCSILYEIKGQEFSHAAEDGSHISLRFSDEGFLVEMKMKDVSENVLQEFEVVTAGKNFGKLDKMYIDGEMAEGVNAMMEKLEEKAEGYGFRVGEDLPGSVY